MKFCDLRQGRIQERGGGGVQLTRTDPRKKLGGQVSVADY